MKKFLACTLSLILALAIVPYCFADDVYVVPDVYMKNHDKYYETGLTDLDILQNQVVGFETEDEFLPDFDIYLFFYDGGVEECLREEAGIYGVNIYESFGPNNYESWAYDSMEYYDDLWFFCKNVLFKLPSGNFQETCFYEKVNKIELGDGNHFYLPKSYTPGAKYSKEQDFVVANYTVSTENTSETRDAIAVETTFTAGQTAEELTEYIVRKNGLDFEQITLSGRTYYVVYGNMDANGIEKYAKCYIYDAPNGASGIQFWYDKEANGFDIAIMSALNF